MIDPKDINLYTVRVSGSVIPLKVLIDNILNYIIETGIGKAKECPNDCVTIWFSEVRSNLGMGDSDNFSDDIVNCLQYYIVKRPEVLWSNFKNDYVEISFFDKYIKNSDSHKKRRKTIRRTTATKVLEKYHIPEYEMSNILDLVSDLLQLKMNLLLEGHPEQKYTINNIQNAIREVNDLVLLFMIDEKIFDSLFMSIQAGKKVTNREYRELIYNRFGFIDDETIDIAIKDMDQINYEDDED